MQKRAIIIGASSGIGKALAEVLSADGYALGLTGRRVPLLQEIQNNLGGDITIQEMDVSEQLTAQEQFNKLAGEMGSIDLVIINAGTGYINPDLSYDPEQETIDTNISGFTAIATASYQLFKKQGTGHIVGISSIASFRGSSFAPAYSASKAYVSNYMEGLRLKAFKDKFDLQVTDILPGFVDTPMAKGDGLFWVASPEKAARQIAGAIKNGKKRAYITKRWRLIAWIMKVLPEALLKRV
ncbi:MAG: SDR family NAD(P)-dependent oxidoreductase [Methyloligellaceae bacterium]